MFGSEVAWNKQYKQGSNWPSDSFEIVSFLRDLTTERDFFRIADLPARKKILN